MASLFVLKSKQRKPKEVCNGGLGGLVDLVSTLETGTPKRSSKISKRPPPIAIPPLPVHTESHTFTSSTTTSTSVSTNCGYHGVKTPTTPCTPKFPLHSGFVGAESEGHQDCVFSSGYNNSPSHPQYYPYPPTPSTPTRRLLNPAELPGSILQPHQGFAKVPTKAVFTPPQSRYQSPISPRSVLSNQPEPDIPSGRSAMEKFKYSSPQKATASNDSLTKTFEEMTLEELLKVLPNQSQHTTRSVWIPVVERKYADMKEMMQTASGVRLATLDASMSMYFERLKSLDESTVDISKTYGRIAKEFVPLAERNITRRERELSVTKKQLEQAQATATEQKATTKRDARHIRALQYTLDEQADIFVDFIRAYADTALEGARGGLAEEVRILVEQRESQRCLATKGPETDRNVRTTEAEYLNLIDHIQSTDTELAEYKTLAKEQAEIIRSQSDTLDNRVDDFQKLAPKLAEKNTRIAELVNDTVIFQNQIQRYQQLGDKYRKMKTDQRELRKKCADLDKVIQAREKSHQEYREEQEAASVKKDEALQAAKDAIQTNLRSPTSRSFLHHKTGSNQPKINYSESQPVVSVEQAHGEITKHHHWYGGGNLFGRKNKIVGGLLPASQSMISLSTIDKEDKEPAGKSGLSKRIGRPAPITVSENKPHPLSMMSSAAARPRSNSTGTVHLQSPPAFKIDKDLPSTPPTGSSTGGELESAIIDDNYNDLRTRFQVNVTDPFTNAPVLRPSPTHSLSPRSPVSMFNTNSSHITQLRGKSSALSTVESGDEADQRLKADREDQSGRSTPSATSSDKRAYRKSLEALSLIEILSSPSKLPERKGEMCGGKQGSLAGNVTEGVSSGYEADEEESPMRTARVVYNSENKRVSRFFG